MTPIDSVSATILGIAGVTCLWQLSSMAFINKKIMVRGRVPAQGTAVMLFGVACSAIIIARRGTSFWQIVSVASIMLAVVLTAVVKDGLSEYGMYVNGWSTPYKDMKYYHIEREEKDMTRVRICARRGDHTLLFAENDLQLAIAYFTKNEVPDIETYQMMQKQNHRKKR